MGRRKLLIDSFIRKSRVLHKNKYSYNKTIIKSSREPVTITCNIHGDFKQTPDNHLHGYGCKYCKGGYLHPDDFIIKASLIHNNKYDYSLCEYKGINNKIIIICPFHGQFKQTAQHHLHHKQGCPFCNRIGTSKERWVKSSLKNNLSQFYVLRCFNEQEHFIKLGITSKSINKRYNSSKTMPYEYEILLSFQSTPENIWKLEKNLLKHFSKFKYNPNINFPGRFECFSKDIFIDIVKLDFHYYISNLP